MALPINSVLSLRLFILHFIYIIYIFLKNFISKLHKQKIDNENDRLLDRR